MHIHRIECLIYIIVLKTFHVIDVSVLLKGLRFHLQVTHWLTDRLMLPKLILIFNIIDVFELSGCRHL